MFEAFSCVHLHPNPKAWRLDRLEGMPSVLDDVRSAQCSIKNFPLSREKVLEHVSLGLATFETVRGIRSHLEPEGQSRRAHLVGIIV